MENVDVVIVGGGMVGLCLAAALKESTLSIAIISDQVVQQPLSDQPALRVSAINDANRQTLQSLGVWAHLPAQRISPYDTMAVWDKDSFGRIQFSKDDLPAEHLGHIIENQVLVNALAEEVLNQSNVKLIESRIDKILWGQRETMVMLENDDVVACGLLVGADGANSFIRQQAQLPITFKDYGHTAIVGTIRTELPHDNCARQVFTPHGPLALLPLNDKHLCSIVWSQHSEVASELMNLNNTDFSHRLTAVSDSVLGVLKLESEKYAFPLTMRYARQWVKKGVVIIGDAAHTIHPLAGQGANLGMRDAFALAEVLKACVDSDKSITDERSLRAFERARKADAAKVIAAMEGFKTLFDGDHPLKKLVRGVGLVATDSLPAIKRKWLAQAMGW
ncbi:FAD-dependent monooxygenase [Alteromonas sp. C1M14]|uniref:FAD-dependent monooxygenase n=1 Tax=Alteromonas sp. C1M14 TaxID=2841567 RepID=UPI001C086458|nr:FAD-dependent monooxygenase [Alteromonas sp. C1M14]MBU2979372.1 FAD-dependent monooxygenase [Alteromonas sp. C1M14]